VDHERSALPSDEAEAIIGLSIKEARARALLLGYELRLIAADRAISDEYVSGRMTARTRADRIASAIEG
jgi:hypothetical protein